MVPPEDREIADSVLNYLRKRFPRHIAKREIVKKMLEGGMKVSGDDRIYVAGVEVGYTAMSNALHIDRRVVKWTIQQIRSDPYLYSVFSVNNPVPRTT